MKIIYNNLYQNIIEKHGKHSQCLRIITGYASASQLKKVHNDFPNLKIDLYIGMALDGISKSDHEFFVDYTLHNEKINVFYHSIKPKNHMKIYNFDGQKNLSFIGSANFSEAAFTKQQELMIETEEYVESIFENQKTVSISCIDKDNVNALIPLFEDKDLLENNNSDEVSNKDKNKFNGKSEQSNSTRSTSHNIWANKLINQKIDQTSYSEMELLAVLPKERDALWNIQGINDPDTPHIKATPGKKLEDFFKNQEKFKVYFDDNNECIAYLSGQFNKEIHFNGFNINEYMREKLQIADDRPISYLDLKGYGNKNIKFVRLNELEYFMFF